MRFNCLRTDLSNAVSNVSRAVAAKSTLPALEGVLIKAYGSQLEICGYDLEIGIVTTVEASVSEEGEIVVSARLFNEIIRKLPEEIVNIETDDKMITYINSGAADYQIVGMNSSEYPELPNVEEISGLTINAEILKNLTIWRSPSIPVLSSRSKTVCSRSKQSTASAWRSVRKMLTAISTRDLLYPAKPRMRY